MDNYVLSCCSTVDLTKEKLESRDTRWVPFHYELNGVGHLDDFGQSIPHDQFYKAMSEGATTKTSLVSVSEYEDHFRKIAEQGQDILHVTLSSGLSGTINSAELAAESIMEEYPQRRIIVVDSLGASSGYGLLMDTLADKRDEGMGLEELAAWTRENRLNVHHWFFSTDLHYYVLGGRISKTAGIVGTALKICPVLDMNTEGKLTPREKIRTKEKAMRKVFEMMKAHATDHENYSGKVFVCHSDFLKDAQALAAMIEDAFPNLAGPVEIFPIGTTIGSHTGPGTISLFFWGDERVE